MALVVRAIRSLDRRGGLASRRGARTYGRLAGLFHGLHRAVARDVVAIVGDRAATVIDVGAGPGDLLGEIKRRAPGVIAVGVDPSSEMRDVAASRGIREIDGRAEAMPFADASIDLIVSTLSAHHWDDPVAALRELRRVLRPGGQARIYDVRFAGYGRDEVGVLAAEAGLRPDSVGHEIIPEGVLGLRPFSLITVDA